MFQDKKTHNDFKIYCKNNKLRNKKTINLFEKGLDKINSVINNNNNADDDDDDDLTKILKASGISLLDEDYLLTIPDELINFIDEDNFIDY